LRRNNFEKTNPLEKEIVRLNKEVVNKNKMPFKTDTDLVKKSTEKVSMQSSPIEKEALADEIITNQLSGSVEFGFTYE
jgi:hypothetical protein